MNNLFAALTFFTRLPFWRIVKIPSACYSRVVEFWPLIGWLTGGITASVAWLLMVYLPVSVAVICAYVARLILTGAIHEDGFADFIDGMGGGTSKERILEIMKDSHIGSYGVIGLICYYLLLVSLVTSLPTPIVPLVIFAADPWGKFCGELIVSRLPYARPATEAKNKTVYTPIKIGMLLAGLIIGMIPNLLLPPGYLFSLLLPLIISFLLIYYMRKKIGGYTGDCCGATFICCEVTFIFSAVIITSLIK